MLKTTFSFLFITSFLTASTQPIEWIIYQGRSPYELNQREIKDSGFKSVLIHTLYSDHVGNENWRDTLYFAKFDPQGNIVYEERPRMFVDSIINVYSYDDQNRAVVTKSTNYKFIGGESRFKPVVYFINDEYRKTLLSKRTYTTIKPNGDTLVIVKQFIYDKYGKKLKEFTPDEETLYSYYEDGRLSEETVKNKAWGEYIYSYIYKKNNTDSIVRIKMLERNNDKEDSVFTTLIYNKRGLLIYESRKVSDTYYKTFRPGCTTGDSYTNKWEYDENGRLTVDDNYFYYYTENGVEKISRATGDKITNFKESGISQIDNTRWVREVNGTTTTLTTYLSETSKLLLYIDRMDGPYGNEKVFFTYSK